MKELLCVLPLQYIFLSSLPLKMMNLNFLFSLLACEHKKAVEDECIVELKF